MFWQPLWAQADGIVVSAPGTTLGQAGNGVPIVNIAAPNGSGLSHNQFQDYNVGSQGVILNNATNRTQSTQLGGIILGNSNLNGRAASTILNEVNGGSPSQLRGYTEVAGQSAHVIVANPYGITCNGCGFINTPQATLTTGKPVVENGQVSRYQVDQGSVSIEGALLNANNIDRFEIITRSAKLNAEIQARNLAIITGANDVDAKTLKATARAADPASAPQLAIDSSALGGMYAGAIKLVGTEAGVGVKLDGKMVASGGDIQLDANGHLSMVDAAATGAVNVKAQSLEAKGPVYAGTTLDVNTQGDLTSQNNLVAKDRITLNSGGQLTNNGIIEAGVNADNSRNTAGDVSVTAQNFNNTGKSVIASRDLTVTTAQTLTNQGGTLSGKRQTTVTAGTLDNQNQGRVLSADSLNLTADTVLNGQGGLINSVGQLTATLGHLNNNAGEVSTKASSTLILGTMDNLTGLVMAESTLGLTAAGAINNQSGVISGWQGLTVNGTSLDNRNSGTVSSRSGDVAATLSGALLNSHAGAVVSQKALTVTADSLDNSDQGVLSSGAAQKLTVTGLLDNTLGGSITSSATLTLQAMALNNAGTLSADDALSFTGTDLDNSHGTFTGNAGVTLDLLGTLTNNYGKLSSAGPLLLQRSTQINNQNGGINSQDLLTLLTGSLDNSQNGTIGASDTLLVTASGKVDNSTGGLIASRNADLQLNADSLGNSKGSLQGKGAVTLNVTGDIDNQSGKVIAQDGDLSVTAANLDSRGGLLSSVKGAFESHIVGVLKNGYDLSNNNQGGTIQAQRLALNAFGGIDNNGGRIAAQSGDAVLDARSGNIDNRNGGLYASNLVQVSGNDLDNSGDTGGQVTGQRIGLSLSGELNNSKGIVESGTTLAVGAASVVNQGGQLRALGTVDKTSFKIGGLFDNRGGTVETANNDLDFDVASFQNQGGSLLHANTGVFGISMANLNDVGGRLVTQGDLTLATDTWTNSSSLQANHLIVNVNHLTQTATGQLLSSSGFQGSGNDWRNDGLIGTDGAVRLDLHGGYAGSGRLSGVQTLGLHAIQVDLGDTGSIAAGADATVNIDGLFNSSGRLTSGGNLKLTASGVNNLGTLGSGKGLVITTGNLLNDHGLISSGEDMQLLVSSFTNRYAQVYSLGTALIARDSNGTRADLLDNRSGDIESMGKLTVAATTVNNVMDVLEYTEHEKSATGITRLSCTLIPTAGCDDRGGGRINGLWELTETDRLNVTQSSAAASLTSGADLSIDTQVLNNTSSIIAATGNVQVDANTINNKGLQPQEIKTTRRYWSFVNETGAAAAAAANFNARNNPTPSASYASDLSAFFHWATVDMGGTTVTNNISDKSYDAIIQAGGSVSLNANEKINNSVIRPFYEYVAAGRTATDTGSGSAYSTPIYINAQLPPDLAQHQINPVALPGFTLPAGQNGLFRLSGQGTSSNGSASGLVHVPGLPDTSGKSNPQKYLIETNPALTDLKQFMSSDYLLSNLGYDPDASAKRLGDGFYEQKLIQQAVTARTGQRYIDGQTSDDAMFKYLMNNAVASKQELNLQLGVSLTSEQVAALTHDIVWMENQTINGEQVLVPVLYLASANNRLADNGALIQGSDVTLVAGQDLSNAGTLRASSNLKATASNDLVNSGLLEAGNRLDALATNNLSNKAGGIIAGRDVSVTAVKGDVLNERTVTTHQSYDGLISNRKDFADSAARIEASNDLGVNAGRDLLNQGSVLQSGRDTSVTAGRDVKITSAEQTSNVRYDNYTSGQVTQLSSSLTSGRDVSVVAGRDLSVVASQIDAKRDATMSATGDLTLESAANASTYSGWNKKYRGDENHSQQVSTQVTAGGNVTLNAGKDLGLVSSQVSAQKEAYLSAGANLTLQTATNEDYSFYSKTSKSSSGKKSQLDEESRSTNVASAVSGASKATLVAGNDLLVKGSKVVSGEGAVKLTAGNDVQIVAATDASSSQHDRSQSKSSWLGLKASKVSDHMAAAQTKASGSLISGDTVDVVAKRDATVTGSALASMQDLTVQAGRDLTINAAQNTFTSEQAHKEKNRDLTGILTANKLGIDDITGKQKLFINSGSHDGQTSGTTLTGSTVGSALGNVSLTAGRELNVVASNLVSSKDMSLTGSNVNIVAGMENSNEEMTDKTSSLGVKRVMGGVVVNAVTALYNLPETIKSIESIDDPRLRAVKQAQLALSLTDSGTTLWKTEQELQNKFSQLVGAKSLSTDTSAGFGDAINAYKNKTAGGDTTLIKIGSELASSSSRKTSEKETQTAKASSIMAGQNLAVVSTGAMTGSAGDIHVVGSSLKANSTVLEAKNNITLESAQNTVRQSSDSHTNETSIGVSFNLGAQNGFTLDLGAKLGLVDGKGKSVTQVNSTLETGDLLLHSGKDTTLAGAQVKAQTIDATIDGNLNIASRQDTDKFESKNTNIGFGASLCIPPFCYGATAGASGSASLELSNGGLDRDYRAVKDQSGLFAGKGGYNINVGNNTTLEGAVIASDASVDKNLIVTDRLIVSDIKNKSEIDSHSTSVALSGSYGSVKGFDGGISTGMPLALGESNSSKTRSAVSEGTIIVRDAAGAYDLVGLNRDTAHANEPLDKPDEKALQERIELLKSSIGLTKDIVGKVAEQAEKQAKNLLDDAKNTKGKEDIAAAELNYKQVTESWAAGGNNRVAADIAAGLIGATLGGAGGLTSLGIVANTTKDDTKKLIGDYADTQRDLAKDPASKAAWDEHGSARLVLEMLAGATQGMSGTAVDVVTGAGGPAGKAQWSVLKEKISKLELSDQLKNILLSTTAALTEM
nr:hemagglutinin repeat-containing protein [Pseudomonas vanderleydeniana]